MIVLDNGDKLRGDASVAAVVDYTLHGLAGSDLAQLADGQLADATGDLCTAGATVVVTAILFTNTHNAALTVNLFLLPSGGTARRILAKDLTLGIGFSLHYDGVKVLILAPSGGLVASYTNHASSHVDGNDDIQSATAAQKGFATAAQITKLDGIAVGAISDLVADTTPQLGGDLEYNEKHQIFKTTLTSDNTASGDIITVTFGESVVFGDLVYPDGTANEWMKALGTNVAVKHPVMGVALEAKGNAETGKLLLRGLIRDATHFSGFGLGDWLFLSDATAGAWLNAAPADSGDIVQIVGWVLAANYAYFNPDYTYIELS